MKTETFTPGPWELQSGEECCFHKGNRFAITKSGEDNGEPWNVTIAEVWPTETDADKADAHLIAASPEMFAALEIARATIARLDARAKAPSAKGTLDVIDAAIAKASRG